MVQVSARFELANLRFGLLRVDCKMKKIRRSSILGLLLQWSSFSGTCFWVLYPQFFVGLCFWVCVSGLGVFTFAMTINPHSFDILTELM